MSLPGTSAGAIVWAVIPYIAQAPFRVLEPDGTETRFADARAVARAIRGRQLPGQFELAIAAKLRPVLLIQDRPRGRFADFAALRLVRMEKFSAAEQDAIRSGQEASLLHLGHDESRYGLAREYAVRLTSLHRVHRGTIAGAPVGRVDRADLRAICERVAAFTDLDLSNLVARKAHEFLRRAERGGAER